MKPDHTIDTQTVEPCSGNASAFTLVEVTLAIGFVAVAMLVIMALLPFGVTAGRNAADYTFVANIASDLMDYRRTWLYDSAAPYPNGATLATSRPGTYNMYFDPDGNDVTLSIPPTNSYFKATYVVQANTAANMTNNTSTASVTLTIAWPLINSTTTLAPNFNTRTFYTEFTRLP